MKKTRLLGMLALAAALVFGAVSCKQDAGRSQSSQNSWDNSKDDSTDNPTNNSTDNSTGNSTNNSTDDSKGNSKDDSKTSWDNLKDVLAADEDLSGTWKLTDYYINGKKEPMGKAESEEMLSTKQDAKNFFDGIITTYETMAKEYDGEFSATINGNRDEIQVYLYYKSSEYGYDAEIEMNTTYEKQ